MAQSYRPRAKGFTVPWGWGRWPGQGRAQVYCHGRTCGAAPSIPRRVCLSKITASVWRPTAEAMCPRRSSAPNRPSPRRCVVEKTESPQVFMTFHDLGRLTRGCKLLPEHCRSMEQIRERGLWTDTWRFSPQRGCAVQGPEGQTPQSITPEGAAPSPGKAGWEASRVGLCLP